MKFTDIESEARKLQIQLWRNREKLLHGASAQPLDVFQPELAASFLGVRYEVYDRLPGFGQGVTRFEVAGLVDRQANKIAISSRFKAETMRFTGAHEIGHWMLHPNEVMHRDRPIHGFADLSMSRDPVEREADYFAACFLVPRRLLTDAFHARFQDRTPLALNDTSAFWLTGNQPELLLGADSGSMSFALAVASARRYEGRPFESLAELFGVSIGTMAIRLRELELIQD